MAKKIICSESSHISHRRRKDSRIAKTTKNAYKRAETLAIKPDLLYLCGVLNCVAWNNEI